MNENLQDRTPVFKALVGSHNYSLNTPESDKDYKLFVLPTFDDLYFKHDYTKSITTDEEDIVIYDIRKLSHLFYKANVNYLEVLYSTELKTLLEKDSETYKDLIAIFSQREALCKMNMPYLLNACKGMYFNQTKMMLNEKNKNFNKELGYGPKYAMSAYRIMDFLERYKLFIEMQVDHPFKLAIDYFEDKDKQELLNIRNGIYSLEQIKSILETKYKTSLVICEEFYLGIEPNDKLKEWLDNKLKKIVKDNI